MEDLETEPWHGTTGGYTNHACRGPACTRANTIRQTRSGAQRKHLYGVSRVEWAAMFERQQSRCAICGEVLVFEGEGSRRAHLDHDHTCCPRGRSCGMCIRGILCNECNIGLGMFHDNAELLLEAATYLLGHSPI
jgi:hypothetical protein